MVFRSCRTPSVVISDGLAECITGFSQGYEEEVFIGFCFLCSC